ncbi:MAG: cheA [Bacilli bacterium]|nr:cheA [Bacilli bacterium]
MDMNQYLDMFFEESKEHLQIINETLMELEQAPAELELVNTVFRSAHTLKGMSATMGYEKMAHLTHEMENALDLMRTAKLPVTSDVMDLLFRSIDQLESILPAIAETGTDQAVDIESCVTDLKALVSGGTGTPAPAQSSAPNPASLNAYEVTVVAESQRLGFKPYVVTVTLSNTCVLKAARAYMVMQVLEEAGEVIRTEPGTQEIEEDKFGNSFTAIVLTQLSEIEIKERVLNISEIDSCAISSPRVENEQTNSEPQEKKVVSDKKITSKSIRVDIERLDILMNLFSELVINRTRLEKIAGDMRNSELAETLAHMNRLSSDLQSIVMKIRMIQVDTVFNRFPRMVRDLARDLGKKVDFIIKGADTELDRNVIDEIGDPIVHMIRNSLDHALEPPAERLAAGKSETGSLELTAYHSGNHVFIEVTDDGRGIDRDKVVQRAIERNLIHRHQADSMSDDSVFDLLFHSGFSTAEKVSDLSGRGVGLDVVKSKIESLGGKVVVKSTFKQGTKFIIQLPLTLTIMQALLVTAGDEQYAIPLNSIIETNLLQSSDIKQVQQQDVMDFRGNVIPLLYLKQIFEIPQTQPFDNCHVVVIRKGNRMAALVVDSFIGQQEIVLKSLGEFLAGDVFAISGATILGDGQVSLIIDCNALIA